MNRPIGITLIGYFYILGALILFMTLSIDFDVRLADRFGIPQFSEIPLRIIIGFFSLTMSYGYLKLRRWGYWTMIIYSLIFGYISLNLVAVYQSQPFIGNAVFSIIVITYTYRKRVYFLKRNANSCTEILSGIIKLIN